MFAFDGYEKIYQKPNTDAPPIGNEAPPANV